VPATRIALIQKYVGGKKARPRLATIGGRTWVRQKQAAEKAVTDLAADMLELHAARAARPGIAFPADTEWQREFDAAFPYDETPDQLAALTSIKEDMQRPRPMDRLLCGDVGYGKTEVAIRAAFKAVDSGYQVAVLVPTTILAEQHLATFQGRMAEFPFQIAALSRFSTKGEQQKVVESLAEGGVDIVIGTHRLASPDVAFHNLGLVIIDEEQRFGVEVKDRLKRLRQTVDVLTMTATPIPRTLHLSLVGARDISNLETPPEERFAVETKVSRFDEDMIRHALLRELARQGQAYFVHNRIEDIQLLAARLKKMVPEARISIGHGQMPEHQLEQVMLDFIAHRSDVLLATTIVESGLDIPNANTIFIDEADRYGLADLHQLRGRVGRYKHRAFCYLLLDPRRHVAPNAARRLRAIEEFSQMGAGFAIAMRDLEIRGAGNILGTEQSGHIAAVGYEMYCELLEDAVRRLKREPLRGRVDVDIVLPVEAHLPRSYVGDMRAKLDLYRRLGRASSQGDADELTAEMIDRFGPLPAPALMMVELTRLRCDAALWGLEVIQMEDSYLVLRYRDRTRIEQLARHSGGRLRVVDEASAYLPLGAAARRPDEVLSAAKTLLRPL
jgi:transcription-repair coupling factor (superfamily II helicase)